MRIQEILEAFPERGEVGNGGRFSGMQEQKKTALAVREREGAAAVIYAVWKSCQEENIRFGILVCSEHEDLIETDRELRANGYDAESISWENGNF